MPDVDLTYDLDVPGTSVILDLEGEVVSTTNFTLVPTPSLDPADPLNWSQGRKYLNLACVVLYTTATCFCATCLYSIYEPVGRETGLSLAQLNAGIGYLYLAIGIFGLVSQPLALAIGKRPVYIISCLVGSVFPFWLTRVKNNGEWIASCIVTGFFTSIVFVLPEASVSDVFFYHERALPMGMWVATQYGAALLAPLLSGYIFTGLGWRAPPYMAGGFSLISALILIIFLEETNYRRNLNIPVPAREGDIAIVRGDRNLAKDAESTAAVHPASPDDVMEHHDDIKVDEAPRHMRVSERIVAPWPGPRPWKMFTISPNTGGIMLRGIIYPVMLVRHPIVLWCGLIYGLYQIFFNLQAALCSGVLSAPPYNFAPNYVGLTYLSPLIATMPGAILGGHIADRYTIWQARKNHGISEAEHKLKLLLVPTVLAPFALLMLGLGPYYEAHWMVFVAGMFVISLIGPLAALLGITYAFDTFHSTHPDRKDGPQAEVQQCAPYLLCVMALCMILTFGFNYVITPWAFGWGFKNFAISAVFVSLLINCTHFAMVRWGKRLRKANAAYYRKVINW